jgi:protein tyrosine phosphatase (PTP) superfamily phosphohydrolase (DUF442 family)
MRQRQIRIVLFALFCSIPAHAQQSTTSLLNLFETRTNVEAPVVLCIDDKPTVGGQPSTSAYAKAAANGFRSVLTLRAPADGIDVNRERFMVEQNKMRYFNIPLAGKLPARRQVDEFLTVARDRKNHPMLVNCAFAERVAPFMMVFRIHEQGWTEKRAVEEAASSGLKKEALEKFARDYFAPGTKKPAR